MRQLRSFGRNWGVIRQIEQEALELLGGTQEVVVVTMG